MQTKALLRGFIISEALQGVASSIENLKSAAQHMHVRIVACCIALA
jgi:hypothetical protein